MKGWVNMHWGKIAIAGVSGLILLTYLWFPKDPSNASQKPPGQQDPGFPVEIDESTPYGLNDRWAANVLIAPEHYNKENLDKLFLWYSRRHPDKRLMLDLMVYTNREHYEVGMQKGEIHYLADGFRKGEGISGGGNNLGYRYKPDPNQPDLIKSVVLRGGTYYRDSDVVSTWSKTNEVFQITVQSYVSDQVEPQGTYYTFKCATKARGYEDTETIMTLRLDTAISLPQESIVFFNEKTGYVYLGWLFAMTNDGGETWHLWDAEMELPDWQCCDQGLIRSVQILPDGTGSMALQHDLQQPEELTNLRTKDYGQHWKNE